MPRLDFSQPHAEVYGVPGTAFEQNGRYFRPNGDPVVADTEAEPAPVAESESKSVADLPDKQLKVLVEQFGGEWQGRARALAFLEGVPL